MKTKITTAKCRASQIRVRLKIWYPQTRCFIRLPKRNGYRMGRMGIKEGASVAHAKTDSVVHAEKNTVVHADAAAADDDDDDDDAVSAGQQER